MVLMRKHSQARPSSLTDHQICHSVYTLSSLLTCQARARTNAMLTLRMTGEGGGIGRLTETQQTTPIIIKKERGLMG